MDAAREDLLRVIVQTLMDARYAPPRRRRSAWHEGYNEDLAQARQVAEAIVGALQTAGFCVSRNLPALPHRTP